jgi:hypothetical protein
MFSAHQGQHFHRTYVKEHIILVRKLTHILDADPLNSFEPLPKYMPPEDQLPSYEEAIQTANPL